MRYLGSWPINSILQHKEGPKSKQYESAIIQGRQLSERNRVEYAKWLNWPRRLRQVRSCIHFAIDSSFWGLLPVARCSIEECSSLFLLAKLRFIQFAHFSVWKAENSIWDRRLQHFKPRHSRRERIRQVHQCMHNLCDKERVQTNPRTVSFITQILISIW